MTGKGIANPTGWAGKNEGFLCVPEEDGTIKNVYNFFGDNEVSGFTELNFADSNKDGVIDESDDLWSKMRLWVDSNSNGKVDEGELKPLNEFNIK